MPNLFGTSLRLFSIAKAINLPLESVGYRLFGQNIGGMICLGYVIRRRWGAEHGPIMQYPSAILELLVCLAFGNHGLSFHRIGEPLRWVNLITVHHQTTDDICASQLAGAQRQDLAGQVQQLTVSAGQANCGLRVEWFELA